MENRAGIAMPGGWVVRLTALFGRLPRHGAQALRSLLSEQGPVHDTYPTTMQIIERVSALHQDKVGFSALYFAGEFRRRC